MAQTVTKSPLACLVAQSCLAEAYLRQVLSVIPHVRALSLDQYDTVSPLQRKNIVFVVDKGGLDIPLSVCLRELRTGCQDPKFLVVSDDKSIEEIVKFLILGAHGFVPYAELASTLGRAVLWVAANKLWVPPEALQEFLREAASALRKKDVHDKMATTPREDQILGLLRMRLSNKEIAQLLHIRLTTVKFHVSNILSKTQARTRRDLLEAKPPALWRMLAS